MYYTTRPLTGNGAVMRATIMTDGVETLVSGLSDPHGIAVDDTAIYFTTTGDGKIWRLAKP